MEQGSFFARVGTVVWWPFSQVRPQLRSALGVLYLGALAAVIALTRVAVGRAFGNQTGIELELRNFSTRRKRCSLTLVDRFII